MDIKNIITLLLGQFIRHGLTALAALLGAYGVTADQQTAFINSTYAIIIAVVAVVISQGWAYISKKLALDTMPVRK